MDDAHSVFAHGSDNGVADKQVLYSPSTEESMSVALTNCGTPLTVHCDSSFQPILGSHDTQSKTGLV